MPPLEPRRLALILSLGVCIEAQAAAEDLSGVVILLGEEHSDDLAAEVRRLRGADFVLEHLIPAPAPASAIPTPALEEMRTHYSLAAFIDCLDRFERSDLDIEDLLAQGHRDFVGMLETLAAGCAFGAGEEQRARRLLRGVLQMEIDPSRHIEGTTPAFQELVEATRAEMVRIGRVQLSIRVRPRSAELAIDGRPVACADDSCSVEVIPGEHFVVAKQLGFRDLVTRVQVADARTLDITMDAASSREAREQLETWIGTHDGDQELVAAVAATAFECAIVIIAWNDPAGGHAVLYDQRLERVITRAAIDAEGDTRFDAVRSVVRQWRATVGPGRVARNPWFWTGIGSAIAAGLSLFFVLRDPGIRYDLQVDLEPVIDLEPVR